MSGPLTVLLCLDGDAAGYAGMVRAVKLIESDPNGPDLRIVVLPKGYDPDKFLQESPEQWAWLAETARRPIDIAIEALPRVPSAVVPRALELLATIRNPFERAYYLDRMSHVLRTDAHQDVTAALEAIQDALDRQ